MKLPKIIDSIIHKQHDTREVYLSLYLDVHSLAASFWALEPHGVANILANEYEIGLHDSWEEKIASIDRLLGLLEEKTGVTDVTKVIFGLPSAYLTATGEIKSEVRSEIKEASTALELKPAGFVPVHEAVIYKLKHDEGVPPSVILLGVNKKTVAMSVYKIGSLTGLRDLEKHEDVAATVEEGLKSFTDLEVLPARMLLYGSDTADLEKVKSELLKHQWTSRVNFLHFPKIDVISNAFIIDSVSLAGASELGHAVELVGEEPAATVPPPAATPLSTQSANLQAPQEEEQSEEEVEEELGKEEIQEESEIEPDEESVSDDVETHVADESVSEEEQGPADAEVEGEVLEAEKDIKEDFSTAEEPTSEDANVVMVDAESLGFKKDVDVLEEEEQLQESKELADDEESEPEKSNFALPAVKIPDVASVFRGFSLPSFGKQSNRIGIIVAVVVLLLILVGAYWLVPHATVTILEITKPLETVESVTIDPNATTIDAQHKIIPGKQQQTTVSGSKTVPVNGKKDIGDPARGTVALYNKTTTNQTLDKGTVVTYGSFSFTLDSSTTINAATVTGTLGGETTTFGQTTAAVTAAQIGPDSNLPANTTFAVKGFSSDEMIGNNSSAFSGGTSKTVTVVSRADEDGLVQSLTTDLVGGANQQLSQTVGDTEKLIDGTIKTKVTEKVFNQEIDQQATQLSGKLTLTVSGISYSETDVKAILTTLIADQVPNGYAVKDTKTAVSVDNVKIKKDGTITADVHMKSEAFPIIDIGTIRSAVTGKSLTDVERYLRAVTGIAGVEVSFRFSPTKSRLPINRNNITVSLSQ